MNCTPIWPEHVDRQRQRRLDMAINRLKTNLELIINAGSAKSDLLGSDQIRAERSRVEWSGSPSIGGRTAKCCCRCCHSLACQRAWQWELPHRMAFMNESQNTHTKLWAKSQTQSCVHSMSESEFESESEYVIWICFFVWLFVCLSFFAVCGFGDLAICKVWN